MRIMEYTSPRSLIIAAHLDDFEIGMGGTVARLADYSKHTGHNHPVRIVVMCQGDRPGHESVSYTRRDTCLQNAEELGVDLHMYDYSDTKLEMISQTELCNIIFEHICEHQANIIYTHYSNDVHKDHRILSQVTRVASRMRESSPVHTLLEYTIPGSSEWGFDLTGINTFRDITGYAEQKMELISRYKSEVREAPDPVSMSMISARDTYHGSLCGFQKAEAFKQIYNKQ